MRCLMLFVVFLVTHQTSSEAYILLNQEVRPGGCPGGNCGAAWSSCPGGNCNAGHAGTPIIHNLGCPGGNCVTHSRGLVPVGGCPGGNCDANLQKDAASHAALPLKLGGCPGGNCGTSCPGGNCGTPWSIPRLVSSPTQLGGCPKGNCGTLKSFSCPGGNCHAGNRRATDIQNIGGCPGGNCDANLQKDAAPHAALPLKLGGCPGGNCGTSCPGGNCGTPWSIPRIVSSPTQLGGCPKGNCGTLKSFSCPGGNCPAGNRRAADIQNIGGCPDGNCDASLKVAVLTPKLGSCFGGNCGRPSTQCVGGNCGGHKMLNHLSCPGGRCRVKRSGNPRCPKGNCRQNNPPKFGRRQCNGSACLRSKSRCLGRKCRVSRSPAPWGFNSPCFKGGCNNRRGIPCVGRNCNPIRVLIKERKVKSN